MAIINGTASNDELWGTSGPDTMNGWEGNDVLRSGAGDDTLIGGLGSDHLDGGTGADLMYGGLGHDTYYVDSVGDQTVELLADAAGGVDLVRATVSHTLSSGIENLALTGTSNLNGNGNALSNTLYGNAGHNVLSGQDGLDVLYGEGGNDGLFGDEGNDTLNGQSGQDFLDGGAGADRMYGGKDNDRYLVDNVGDQAVEDSADALGGVDHVIANVSYTLGYGIENLSLNNPTTALNGTGNGLNNYINGNRVGSSDQCNTLWGTVEWEGDCDGTDGTSGLVCGPESRPVATVETGAVVKRDRSGPWQTRGINSWGGSLERRMHSCYSAATSMGPDLSRTRRNFSGPSTGGLNPTDCSDAQASAVDH